MDVGGKKLKVTKASIGPTQVANFDVGIAAISSLAAQTGNEAEQSRVLQLLNMVTAEELLDNDEYEGKSTLGACVLKNTLLMLATQKSARTFARSVPSSAPLPTSRCRGHLVEAGNLPASARFSSSSTQ
jgi:hypothetical protein